MQANYVVYEVRRGRDGLPCVIRTAKQHCPADGESAGQSKLSSQRANEEHELQEDTHV
jgi:hypothetical protein